MIHLQVSVLLSQCFWSYSHVASPLCRNISTSVTGWTFPSIMKRSDFLKTFEKALLGHISDGLCSNYCSLGCLLSFHEGKEDEDSCSCICSIAVVSQFRNFVHSVMLR